MAHPPVPSTEAILLQGRESGLLPLFLMTCCSGLASSYINFPSLPNGRRVYPIESPFVGREEEFTCTIQQLAHSFANAVRRVQASGPYALGGSSIGAAYAIEVARILAAEGEAIGALLIIDYHAESLYENIREPDYEVFDVLKHCGRSIYG